MDHRPTLNRSIPAVGPRTVTAEQAVFTSVRTVTGQGYRIVAASRGLGPGEKAEITSRSPSHGSLCGDGDAAAGLSAYPLASGRYVIADSRYGATEYTARGGCRIETRIVLLGPDDYVRFGCNPLRVQRAVIDAVGTAPWSESVATLEPLSLSLVSPWERQAVTRPPCLGTDGDGERFERLVAAVLDRQRLVAVGGDDSRSLLEWMLLGVPPFHRQGLAVSAGLKFSLSRQFHLVVVDRECGHIHRAIAGHDVRLFDVNGKLPPLPPSAAPYETWLALMRHWWNVGRHADIVRLTARMTAHQTPQDLARVAELCRDLDAARAADEPTRARLRRAYTGRSARDELETDLLQRLMTFVQSQSEPEQSSSVGSAIADHLV